MADLEGRFAADAKDFHLMEYESQRKLLELLFQDYRSLERNVVIAVGVTWGWLFKEQQPPVPAWAWFTPCLFAILGALRALGIEKSASASIAYLKRLEDAFSRADDPGGWEHSFGGRIGQIRTAYLFWIALILAPLGVGFARISK